MFIILQKFGGDKMSHFQKGEKKPQRIGYKAGKIVAWMLAINTVIVVGLCVFMFRGLAMEMLQNECTSGTNMLAYYLEKFPETNDQTKLLDELKQQTGYEFTIFEGDTRAYTTIEQNGRRATGTKLVSQIAEVVIGQGKTYTGMNDIVGIPHVCSYVPITYANGEQGIIFAGIPETRATSHLNITILLACIAGGILILISLMLLTVSLKKMVSHPLAELTNVAKTMERGELNFTENKNMHSNDEIGILSHSFESTRVRLKEYIGEISSILKAMSEGDLTVSTAQEYIGDFVSIKESLNFIIENLNKTMTQIVQSSEQVSSGSEQMAIAANALSQGAVEQASAIEDLEGTIAGISKHVEETAQNAEIASKEANEIGVQIGESNEKMKEMIKAIEEINHSSNEIGKIIKTIEDIAFQTNILALNASVEAARAGVAGKGFAVVADEVRNLAAKSADASKSTTLLIEHSVSAVKNGTTIVNQTAEQLSSVVSGANKIINTIGTIANNSREEADSVSQVKEQINQISSVVQTNSATAEQSAATSQQLNEQSRILKQLVRVFHLK